MMKKFLLVLTGFILAVAVLGVVGFAYAQTQNPPDSDDPCLYCGSGNGYAGRNMMAFTDNDEYGLMHETMIAVFADALDMTQQELEAHLAAGDTLGQMAAAQGFSTEEFTTLMLEARTAALEQAVAEGLITQEQADWMLNRWNSMRSRDAGMGFVTGPCQGGTPRGGMGGRGGGRWSGNQ